MSAEGGDWLARVGMDRLYRESLVRRRHEIMAAQTIDWAIAHEKLPPQVRDYPAAMALLADGLVLRLAAQLDDPDALAALLEGVEP